MFVNQEIGIFMRIYRVSMSILVIFLKVMERLEHLDASTDSGPRDYLQEVAIYCLPTWPFEPFVPIHRWVDSGAARRMGTHSVKF